MSVSASSFFSAKFFTPTLVRQRFYSKLLCGSTSLAKISRIQNEETYGISFRDKTYVSKIADSIQKGNTKARIVDVRDTKELDHGMIPGAVHLPFSSLEDALKMDEVVFSQSFGFPKPSKEEEIVFYCKQGGRATCAAMKFSNAGHNASCYPGSFNEWFAKDY
mmetsp:Transcript_16871/g.20298  ORF Transcript_16871/g.20298 Transcript_16871/m.20298 type:complete len:163 (-) Transcript_16871:187-675(-)|eukprot:jgi/Bigna1/62296/fgenesh1_kg.33_\